MATPIKQILDETFTEVRFDAKLAKRIAQYVGDLMNRNDSHVMFFGSNLTGVYPLRFKTSDKNEWFIDILDVDESTLTRRIVKESIWPENWVRVNDAFNMSALYIMHRFMNSSLPPKEKQKAIDDTAMALNIRLLGSIMAWYFKYDVDERTAEMVYARLSRKFHIKKFGNWRKVLENRSSDITSDKSKWTPVLQQFTDDPNIGQCISDIQGRLRSMVKYIWDVFAEVHAEQSKFGRTSLTLDNKGEKIVQELKRGSDIYKRYIVKSALETHTFIKDEVLAIIVAETRTAPEKLILDVLRGVVEKANTTDANIVKFLETAVEFSTEVISKDRTAKQNLNDLSWLLNKIKLYLTAAKTKDEYVLFLREHAEILTKAYASTRNPTIIAAVKTAVILYVIGRTFTMHHYG